MNRQPTRSTPTDTLFPYPSLFRSLGDAAAMLGSVTRPLYAWDAGVPGYGYVRGLQAFALEETGNYSAAEVAGRDAISRNAGDVWAAHAVAHVMEMQDRPQEGVAWVAGPEHAWGA